MSISTQGMEKALNKLREMVQFGPGLTFADMMQQFRALGGALEDIWPWVPFSPDGKLLCTVMPITGHGFELILVKITDVVRFPNDKNLGFVLGTIAQTIHVLEGGLDIEYADQTVSINQGEVHTILKGNLAALNYRKGVYLFRQEPRIAETDDFGFGKLHP